MKDQLLAFFRVLDAEFPLPPNQHHGMMRMVYEGNVERLALVLVMAQGHQIFYFDDGELEDPVQSVARLRELVNKFADAPAGTNGAVIVHASGTGAN